MSESARPEIVVVRRADRQRLIVILEIPRIILFERIESLEVVGPEMQKERGQQTRRASVAVIMRVNRGVLVVRNAGLERRREIVFMVDPRNELLHQPRDVPGLWWHINNRMGASVADHILPIAPGRGFDARFTASHNQSVQLLDIRLGHSLTSSLRCARLRRERRNNL